MVIGSRPHRFEARSLRESSSEAEPRVPLTSVRLLRLIRRCGPTKPAWLRWHVVARACIMVPWSCGIPAAAELKCGLPWMRRKAALRKET